MRARLLIHERLYFDDGHLIEIKVWRVAGLVQPTTHGLEYSLFYGREGLRIVGYDNERGQGDHRHYRNRETAYRFVSIEQLLADFRADVEEARGAEL